MIAIESEAPVIRTAALAPLTSIWRNNKWWMLRILMLPVHLAIFTVATFLLLRLVPGDPVLNLLPDTYTPEQYLEVQQHLGLDGSLLDQLVRYFQGLLTLDLGSSIGTGKPVVEELALRFPQTLEIALISLAVTIIVGVLVSYCVVMYPRNPIAAAFRMYTRAAGAIPEYILAVVGLYLFYSQLRWAPAPIGRLSTGLSQPEIITGFPILDALLQGRFDAAGSISAHLVLPIVVMTIAQAAYLAKILSASLEEAFDAAPTRFRIAAGVSRWRVLVGIYRRAAPPGIIMLGAVFGGLVGGAIIIESLFGFSGVGSYAVAAVSSNDYVAVQTFLLLIATLTLSIYLIVDIVNMLLDPRRRPGVRVEN